MRTSIYRDGKKVTGNAIAKFCVKTLSTTGEHEVWSGAAATMTQPDDGPLSLVSTSQLDAPLVRDTWTLTGAEGTDPNEAVVIDGVTHASISLTGGALDALAAAVVDGSKQTWLVEIATAPDSGDTVTLSVGATPYAFQSDGEDAAGIASALAALAVADASYTVTAQDEYLICVAKLPAVAAPAVAIDFATSGAGSVSELIAYGPASAVMTATAGELSVVLEAVNVGEAYVVTSASDNIVATHTATGGVGTGLQTVLVEYLDGDGLLQRKRVDLDGTTAVQVADDEATALLDCYALAVGANGGAVGTVTIADDSPTAIATIAVGASEVIRAEATPPEQGSPGVRNAFLLTGLQLSVTGAACTLRVRKTGPSGGGVLWQATVAAGGNEQWDLSNAPVVCEKSERLFLTIEGNGATATVGWVGYYTGEAA